MKGYIICWAIALILIVSGVFIVQSDWGGRTNYYSSGKILLDKVQWEQFKSAIITEPSIKLDDLQALNGDTKTDDKYKIKVLDWGDSKVVELNKLKVFKDFKFGNITSDFNKEGSGLPYILEGTLIPVGAVCILMTFLILIISSLTD